jgi:thioredoxin reductase (NADPH)
MKIYNQLLEYNPQYLFESVINTDLDKKIIKTNTKTLKYKNLIIATGRRNRTLNLDNEEKYIGKGISFCASCDGNLYKEKEVAVIGGANSAISEALYLANICKKVYLIYRKDELRGEVILKDRIKNKNNIEVIYNANVKEYLYDNDKIVGFKLNNNKNINISCIFLAIGYVPNSELFDVEKINNYIIVDKNYLTNKKNVYACGDVIKKDLYQLITSSAEGALVANDIINNRES